MILLRRRNVADNKMLSAAATITTATKLTTIFATCRALNSPTPKIHSHQQQKQKTWHLHVTRSFQLKFLLILYVLATISGNFQHIQAKSLTPPTLETPAVIEKTTKPTIANRHPPQYVGADVDVDDANSNANADGIGLIGATSLVAAAAAAVADADLPMSVGGSNVDIMQPPQQQQQRNYNNKVNITSNNNKNNGSNNSKSHNKDRQLAVQNNGHREMIAKSANLLLENLQHPTGHIVNLTRHHDGDVFRTNGVASCNADTCVGLSSGTASLLSDLHANSLGHNRNHNRQQLRGGQTVKPSLANPAHSGSSGSSSGESCQCRCLPYLSTYREDLGICVDDVHECTLSPFVSGSSSEKIPFVFLPLRSQIIYPSREISFLDIRTPVCAVTGAQFLTTNGWSDLRNPIDSDYPFRMFRDEGRTFLQWLGEPDLRKKMQGRLIVVHLVCRDMSIALNATMKEHLMPPKNVFSPCVAFRVNGSPVKYAHNVSEVLFQSETTATLASTNDGMTTKEYVVIAACSLLLGLIYVASVFLYLHMKKRKGRGDQRHMRNSLDDLANEINYPKNDQVTFGAPFNRSGSLYSATSLGTSNEPRSRASIGSLKEEMGIVKNNPLLQHFPQLNDHHSGFASDISNSNSECETDCGNNTSYHDKLKQLQTSALIHPQLNKNGLNANGGLHHANNLTNERAENSESPTPESECMPAENVAIAEDMMNEEKLENLRAMVNGNVRKKLYFNPAYFEPHLLADPPAAAVEFLQKIREVIAIAKYKMATKRYQPSLSLIPEEAQLNSNSSTSTVYGVKMPTSTTECQACLENRCSGHVKNCGDKRNSIEKWLETVAPTEREKLQIEAAAAAKANENNDNKIVNKTTMKNSKDNMTNVRNSPPKKEITPPKQRPPPPPIQQKQQSQSQQHEPQQPHSSQNDMKSTQPLLATPAKSIIEIKQTEAKSSTSHSSKIYQHYTTTTSVNVPIQRNSNNYETFSKLTAAANIYGFAETGSEIYNNPKFILHDSPAASQHSRGSSQRSKAARKRLETLEQYAAASSTPTSLTSAERQHYEYLREMKQLPSELRPDYTATISTIASSFNLDIPTPDYDSTMEKTIKDIYNNTQSSGPSVPTPDYSSLSRKSLKQYQPDSPIYRRKSPQYLIVDYETDSLERLETTKRKSSHSSSSPSSDVSSQMSPSLSTALPLEEELEISHTVYNKMDAFRKDGELKQKMPNNGAAKSLDKEKEMAARIKYDTPFRGSMTIEVEHEPQSDLERSTDSEQFEPDTLDRKPKKQSFCDALSEQLKRTVQKQQQLEHEDDYMQATNLSSLPDMSRLSTPTHNHGNGFHLNQSNSFRSQQHDRSPTYETHVELRMNSHRNGFGSLNDLKNSTYSSENCKCGVNAARDYETLSEQGRLLTLEAKQKRRQRLLEPSNITPPPVVEITQVSATKTTIKISTPKVDRNLRLSADTMRVEPQVRHENAPPAKPNRIQAVVSTNDKPQLQQKRALRSPPPPPPPLTNNASSLTLNSQKSTISSHHNDKQHRHNHHSSPYHHHHYQNQPQFSRHATPTEDETMSNHSECTEITGVSDNFANSERGESCNNTLNNETSLRKSMKKHDEHLGDAPQYESSKKLESPIVAKKVTKPTKDYGALFNTQINGLRSDYSLTKYLNRRKNQNSPVRDTSDEVKADENERESNNNINNNSTGKLNNELTDRLDVISISSRSNRSSSRLSDRTKEMYRNAGVPVGIAYPQRSTTNATTANGQGATTSVQTTVYRCEIEPVQLTHGMQIAMGLKDRAKKAKDLKNAWKKFVSLAASKFSPTQSPAPPFDKKPPNFLEVLDRDEGISSLIIDDQTQMTSTTTVQSSYSAPPSQNYYEQRFGARTQEMDSGYMSADSAEVYKRSFYDRYNLRSMTGRDHIIRVDTIEDRSDDSAAATPTGDGRLSRRSSILDSNRFEDFEHMGEPPSCELVHIPIETASDNESVKTLTREEESSNATRQRNNRRTMDSYSSEDDEERGHSPSYGSSETEGETNIEDTWESGAESIETHSVLYKNVKRN